MAAFADWQRARSLAFPTPRERFPELLEESVTALAATFQVSESR